MRRPLFSVVDHLPPSTNRVIGLSGLFAIGCYLIWLIPQPRIVGRADWRIALPNLRRTLLQIGIGTLDRCLASLSIFMLLPASPAVGFATIVVIFVLATLLGAVSHAPGSLGVVEAAILIGLPQYQREELLATLLTFRVLDFFFRSFSLPSCSACANCGCSRGARRSGAPTRP